MARIQDAMASGGDYHVEYRLADRRAASAGSRARAA